MGFGSNYSVFGARDARIRVMLSDDGGGSVYGDYVDIPGIMELTLETDMVSEKAIGDDTIVAVATRKRGYNCKLSMALESLDVFKAVLGGTLTDSGVAPNQQSELVENVADRCAKFEIIVQSNGDDDSPNSVVERVFPKCSLTKFSGGAAAEKFSVPSMEFTAYGTKSNGDFLLTRVKQTGTGLPAAGPADTVAPTVLSSVPADGDTGVLTTATIAFTFSEPIEPARISDPGSYYLATAAGVSVAFSVAVSVGNTVATLTPAALSASTTYVAGVTRNIKDLAGNRLAAQYGIDFTTA